MKQSFWCACITHWIIKTCSDASRQQLHYFSQLLLYTHSSFSFSRWNLRQFSQLFQPLLDINKLCYNPGHSNIYLQILINLKLLPAPACTWLNEERKRGHLSLHRLALPPLLVHSPAASDSTGLAGEVRGRDYIMSNWHSSVAYSDALHWW